jgi:type I restriction enzyme S subunit
MECVLKDLIAVSKDGEWGKGEPFDESVKMLAIRGTDFEDVRFGNTATTPRRYIPKHIAERKRLCPWDVVIEAAGGTKNQITGRTVLLRPELFARSELPLTCASFSRFIRFNMGLCDPAFMFWYLQHLYASGAMHAYHTQHTGVARFQWTTFSEREPLLLPPLPVQRRIAGILSAYDELIENSQRRIKILESMARALYREWFVHFRFPGHESVPRVASPLGEIPQGWEVKPFSAFASYVNGYPFKPAQLGNEGKPIIKIKELKAGIVADTPRNLGDEIPEKYTIHDGYVLFSWSADLDTYLWMGGEGLLNQHLFNVVPIEGISCAFCFHALKESMPRFRALSLGATMHHIKRSALDQVFTLLPPEPLRKHFEGLVEPMHRQLITLSKHVENLRRTRDLLLPRLLSGQIDVEALDHA